MLIKRIITKIRIEVQFLLEHRLGLKKVEDPYSIRKMIFKKYLPKHSIIIDCGAHVGADSIQFSKLFPNTIIHSFEPVPHLFAKLQSNTRKYKNIICHNLALSNENGKANFYISAGDSDASSSLLQPKEHLIDHKGVTFENAIEVETISLDSWAERNNIRQVDFLWLDMQGFELPMLQASKKILPSVKAIFTEVSLKETYEGVVNYKDYSKWMIENNFVPITEKIPPNSDMGNVLFERKQNANN